MLHVGGWDRLTLERERVSLQEHEPWLQHASEAIPDAACAMNHALAAGGTRGPGDQSEKLPASCIIP